MNKKMDNIKKFFPFEEYRKNQEETIKDMVSAYENEKKFYVLEAPTGFGKSAVAFTASRIILNKINKLVSPPIIVCTRTRMLQDQYQRSFKNYNVDRLWAANHYPCDIHSNDNEFHFGSPLCPGKDSCYRSSKCQYILAKRKFMNCEFGILNYHYFLHSHQFNPHVLVLDEAHNIENILCGIMEVKISMYSIQKLCEILEMMRLQYNRSALVTSCKNVIYSKELDKISLQQFYEQVQECSRIIKSKKGDVLQSDNVEKYLLMAKGFARGIKICENILSKLDRYFKSEVEWIVSDNQQESVSIKPLDTVESSGVLSNTDFTIMMSATICDHKQLCKGLNIELDSCVFKSLSSDIPLENRKVYQINLGSMNAKNKKELFPLFVETIDKIIDNMDSVRGIIHSVSYKNAQKIIDLSKHSSRMVIPKNMLSVEELLLSKEDTILVSPSIMEGVDLKDDVSRFQIFFKVPYAYLGDKWVKTKMDRDYKWYMRDAAIKLVQGSGRSIRSKDDYANTFILDSNFNKIKCMFPEWFKEAIEKL